MGASNEAVAPVMPPTSQSRTSPSVKPLLTVTRMVVGTTVPTRLIYGSTGVAARWVMWVGDTPDDPRTGSAAASAAPPTRQTRTRRATVRIGNSKGLGIPHERPAVKKRRAPNGGRRTPDAERRTPDAERRLQPPNAATQRQPGASAPGDFSPW